jgi:hypothetical protein
MASLGLLQFIHPELSLDAGNRAVLAEVQKIL